MRTNHEPASEKEHHHFLSRRLMIGQQAEVAKLISEAISWVNQSHRRPDHNDDDNTNMTHWISKQFILVLLLGLFECVPVWFCGCVGLCACEGLGVCAYGCMCVCIACVFLRLCVYVCVGVCASVYKCVCACVSVTVYM